MAKNNHFIIFIIFTLERSIHVSGREPPSPTLYLQIGDKCDENSGINNFITFYDDEDVNTTEKTASGEASPVVCNPNFPLDCVAGRCQCTKGYTINRNGSRCLEIARNGLESPCEENIQCWKSLLGRMSECNVDTGRCQCYESSETSPIVFHNGRCYYGESLGDFCQIQGLCEATTPNAICRSGTCQCQENYVPSWDKSRCLPIATGLNSTCEENSQCEQSKLGALSECNQETMKCSCYKISIDGSIDTVFYGGRCYFEAALGNVCQVNSQCLKNTSNSRCSRDGKCVCEDGYIPNENNTLCLPIPSSDGAVSSSNGATGTTAGGGGECAEDSECFRVLGPFSKCNILKQKCECFLSENVSSQQQLTHNGSSLPSKGSSKFDRVNESEQLVDPDMTTLVMIGSRCFLGKYLGQPCKFNKQCVAVTENSLCDNGRCECLDSHVRSEDDRKCLKVAQKGLDSDCDEDAQCSRKTELGPLSRCNLDKKKCECSNNIMPVVYFRGKCYFDRQLGASCVSNVECQAGGNYLAECRMGRCQCQNGTLRLSAHVCGLFDGSGRNSASKRITCWVQWEMVVIGLLLFRSRSAW